MVNETVACLKCGKQMPSIVSTCPRCGAIKTLTTKRRASAGKRIGLGIVFVIVALLLVVGTPLAITYWKYLHPGIGAGAPEGTAGSSTLSGVQGGAPAYAVSDVVSGTDADRAKMNGQTVTVEGYVVDTATIEGKPAQVLSDSATGYVKGSAKNAVLNIAPAQAMLKVGKKAKVAGTYDAKTNALKLNAVTPE